LLKRGPLLLKRAALAQAWPDYCGELPHCGGITVVNDGKVSAKRKSSALELAREGEWWPGSGAGVRAWAGPRAGSRVVCAAVAAARKLAPVRKKTLLAAWFSSALG
jgi:hypothetical protein